MQEQWQACVDRISGQLSAQAYRTYIQPLVCLGFDPASGVLRLGAPSQMKLNIVRDQFGRNIDDAVRACFDPSATVQFEVTPASGRAGQGSRAERGAEDDEAFDDADAAPARADGPADGSSSAARKGQGRSGGSLPDRAADGGARNSRGQGGTAAGSAGGEIRSRGPAANPGSGAQGFGSLGARAPDDRTRLLPDATFATFVTGKANELARAAASKVAERPGTAFNPLFIYGGVGLGKTHLMHAVGNAFLERQPNAAVRYVSANQFFQDMVQALRRETVDQFKNLTSRWTCC